MRSPTARTLKALRDGGHIAKVCERWIPQARKRVDLFGADIMSIQGAKLVAIQTTSGSGHANRVTKSIGNAEVAAFLNTGNAFEVWSWSKRVTRNKDGSKSKVKKWTPRVSYLSLNNDGSVREL
jgi:hypothetical protein